MLWIGIALLALVTSAAIVILVSRRDVSARLSAGPGATIQFVEIRPSLHHLVSVEYQIIGHDQLRVANWYLLNPLRQVVLSK